jgi:malonyl-CoA O-methyltransferase
MPADALMGIDKKAVAGRFNRSANFYDAHCRVQRRMANRLIVRLEGLVEPRRILELGCGTGHLTELLASRFPDAAILAVDFAERMVDRARFRLRKRRVELELADAEALDFGSAAYDLVISNAAIQWFDDPSSTMCGLTAALRPGGAMLHASFGPATFGELRTALSEFSAEKGTNAAGVGLALRGPGEWEALLLRCGLDDVECRSLSHVVHYPSAADFPLELQATGVTYRPHRAGRPAMPPRALGDAVARYDARFRTTDGVPVTYELLEVSGVRSA